MNDTEQKLKNLSSRLTLTAAEKAEHREAVSAFLRLTPAQAVLSPLSFSFLRPALGALLVLVIVGGSVSTAAERTLPGDALYVLKVRVNEPTRLFFTFDRNKRTELSLALIERRLEEFAQVSAREDVKDNAAALVSASLSERIRHAHKNIEELQEKTESAEALVVAVDLADVLEAHVEVLERISDVQPSSVEDVEALRTEVTEALKRTEDLVEIVRPLVEAATDTALDEALSDRQEAASQSLDDIAEDLEHPEDFDAGDQRIIDDSLLQIRSVVDAASKKNDEGDRKNALRLYEEASERAVRLQALIEADRSLGIDVLSEEPEETP